MSAEEIPEAIVIADDEPEVQSAEDEPVVLSVPVVEPVAVSTDTGTETIVVR